MWNFAFCASKDGSDSIFQTWLLQNRQFARTLLNRLRLPLGMRYHDTSSTLCAVPRRVPAPFATAARFAKFRN
jgi:hypothetical protein